MDLYAVAALSTIIGTSMGLRWLSQTTTRYVLATILATAGIQLLPPFSEAPNSPRSLLSEERDVWQIWVSLRAEHQPRGRLGLAPAYERRSGRCGSGPRIVRIWIEELLSFDLVTCDRVLSLSRDKPIDEALACFLLHCRMLCRIDQHHPILIEKSLVAFDEGSQGHRDF